MIFGLSNAEGAGLITGVSGLLGGALSGYSADRAAREYNRGQLELAKYQNQANINLWNLQNAYNSPQAQMQRYREAGLNPNLIYSQGNSGNASGVPEFQMPNQIARSGKADAINQVTQAVTDALSQYLSLKQQDEQNKLLHQQIEGQRMDNILKGLNATNMATTNSYLENYYSNRNEAMQWQNQYNWMNANYMAAVKQGLIDDFNDKMRHEKWMRDWQEGYLPRSEAREDKKLNLTAKQIIAGITHMQFQDYISSQMMPYHQEVLKYNAYNALFNAFDRINQYEHPFDDLGIKLFGAGVTGKHVRSGYGFVRDWIRGFFRHYPTNYNSGGMR